MSVITSREAELDEVDTNTAPVYPQRRCDRINAEKLASLSGSKKKFAMSATGPSVLLRR